MKNGEVIREALLNNTIHLIGEGGFERATTKGIVSLGTDDKDVRLNEVYIYRIFGSKELLYAAAFAELDNELFSKVREALDGFAETQLSFRDKMQEFFCRIWNFLLGNEWRCRTYIRYYYSAYFREQSLRNHRKLLYSQEEIFAPLFKEECDVISLMHTMFMTMMDFAVRVYNGDLENTEKNAYHIFNLLYNSLSSYFDSAVVEKFGGEKKGK